MIHNIGLPLASNSLLSLAFSAIKNDQKNCFRAAESISLGSVQAVQGTLLCQWHKVGTVGVLPIPGNSILREIE